MNAICGNFQEMMDSLVEKQTYPLSFLSPRWTDAQAWQAETRATVINALGTLPEDVPFNANVDRRYARDGLTIEHISYDQPYGPRTEGIFLRPAHAAGPLPGVVALHDHGAFKFFGKEKLVALDNEAEILTRFKEDAYEGLSWATRLAQRGYAVFVTDLFMWGSRKLDPNTVPAEFVQALQKFPSNSDDYIQAYNDFCGNYETLIAKSLFLAGSTWTGMMFYEDQRALDYFVSRPEVDRNRIACGGLSCGGLRSVYLAALDPRIKCMFAAGFMPTNALVVKNRIQFHTWMFHVPTLSTLMDFPDILSLVGQTPALVLYNNEDPLWTLEGQHDAHEKLIKLFTKLGSPERYSGRFYPGLHKLDRQMQDDAFDFFDTWL